MNKTRNYLLEQILANTGGGGSGDVAEEMGKLSKVYGVHDLDIPFNDGIGVTHGYGPVSFSRLSEATDINKSGQIQTFATDVPAITSKGCAFFGELTTLNENSDPKLNWGSAPNSVTQTTGPTGSNDAVTFTVGSSDNRFQFSPTGLSVGDVVTIKWFEREDATGAPTQSKLIIQTLVDCSVKSQAVEIERVNDYTEFYAQVEITGASPVVRLYFGDSIGVGNSGYSFYNFWLIKGDIPNAPIITANGSFANRKGEIATIPQAGNLPRPGEPFYIVVDVDRSLSVGVYTAAVGAVYATSCYCGFNSSNRYVLVSPSESGAQGFVLIATPTKRKVRVIYSYGEGQLSIYEDGVRLASAAYTPPKKFFHSGDLLIGNQSMSAGPMQGYIKNLKIEHGVMTDDLAKAYGKWGD